MTFYEINPILYDQCSNCGEEYIAGGRKLLCPNCKPDKYYKEYEVKCKCCGITITRKQSFRRIGFVCESCRKSKNNTKRDNKTSI